MANLKHVVSDLHQVYLTEMEAKIKPQLDKSSDSSSGSEGGEKKAAGGGGEDNVKKAARQLAYDTRYKARREGIPLERAFSQAVSNSSASAPVKDAAKSMLFGSGNRSEEVETEGDSIQEVRKGDKEMVRVTPKKGYGDQKGYVRFANSKKKKELRDNPQIQSVTPTSHGEPYEGKYKLKPGEKKNTKGDLDGDGTKEPDKHEYAGVKDRAIKAAMKKKSKQQKEELSNWKAELGLDEETMLEIAGEDKEKKITGKGVKNKIVINPELKEGIGKLGGEVLEVEEISEEKPYERIDRLNKERLAKQKAAKDAEKAKRDKSVADFKKFREGERAKGTRHDHILDKWQQKKIAAKKQQAEAVDTSSALSAKQQDTERVQAQNARNQLALDQSAAIKKKKKDAEDRESLKREIKKEMGEEAVTERTRYAKETGKDFKTGNPSEKGGTRSGDSAFDKVSREMRKTGGMMSSRKNAIQPQGKKKVKGAKGYKGVTPVDRIKNKLAQKRKPKPDPYGYGQGRYQGD